MSKKLLKLKKLVIVKPQQPKLAKASQPGCPGSDC